MEIFLRNLIYFTNVVFVLIINLNSHFTSSDVGVNYGLQGDNLPAPVDVVKLYQSENIHLLRLYDPNPDVLNAIKGSGLKVSIGVKNTDVPYIAKNMSRAIEWVYLNILPYAESMNIGWITVGNEMVPTDPDASYIAQAMSNLQSAITPLVHYSIHVSTVVSMSVLGVSYPPSAGDFNDESKETMKGIIESLKATNSPLFINVYPYVAYSSNPENISLDYALFNKQEPIIDGQYSYTSLFDAMVDAFYVALEKNGGENVILAIGETGWPTAGNEPYTNIQNAQTYNQRLIDKVKAVGTPRRVAVGLDCFIFSMFNEDQKPIGVEQNWGLHYPNMNPVYPLTF